MEVRGLLVKQKPTKIMLNKRICKFIFLIIVSPLSLTVLGCSQGMNWREINIKDTGLQVWLPCKPNEAIRQVPLSENLKDGSVEVTMIGCEKDSQQFTVSYLSVPQNKPVAGAKASSEGVNETWIQLFKGASLQALGFQDEPKFVEWRNIKAVLSPKAQYLKVSGQRGMDAEIIWFGYANNLYQVAYYRPTHSKEDKETVNTYFSSIKINTNE